MLQRPKPLSELSGVRSGLAEIAASTFDRAKYGQSGLALGRAGNALFVAFLGNRGREIPHLVHHVRVQAGCFVDAQQINSAVG